MVAPDTSLLDIGCGEGDLLAWLQANKKVHGRGIELSQTGVNRCIALGSVIQGDAEADLPHYPDQAYDYAVLGQTLQTLRNPKDVLEQLVRIARHAIVSVPNFGHWKNRLALITQRAACRLPKPSPTSGTTHPTSISAPSPILSA